jgi:hypothetical protein
MASIFNRAGSPVVAAHIGYPPASRGKLQHMLGTVFINRVTAQAAAGNKNYFRTNVAFF